MPNALRGLYAITPDFSDAAPLCAVDRTTRLLQLAAALAAGGGRWLQYRSKSAAPAERFAEAARLAEFCKLSGIDLVINDDIELALAVDAAGVHLGEDDGDLSAARQRLGSHRVLGVSCYNVPERIEGARRAGADYVAVGAMFPSLTKPAARRASLDVLRQFRAASPVPVVAIGGVTLDNAPQLIRAGADMVAVISDVFDAPDIQTRVRAYQQLFEHEGVRHGVEK